MANSPSLVLVQYGVESVYGTEVPATALMMGVDPLASKFSPRVTKARRRYALGNYSPIHRSVVTFRSGQLDIMQDFNFDDCLAVWSSSIKGAVTPTGAGDDKTWTYPAPTSAANAIDSRTIEATDGNDVFTFLGCICTSWTLSGSNAEDSLVQLKSAWDVKDWNTNALTAALTARTVKVLPGLMMDLYANDAGGTIGSTAKTGCLIDWAVTWEYAYPKRRAAGALTAYAVGKKVPSLKVDLTLENNAAGKGEKDALLANTGRLLRLIGLGDTIGAGPATYKLQIDAAGDYTNDPALWDNDEDDTTIKLTLEPKVDSGAFANYFQLVTVNELAAVVG